MDESLITEKEIEILEKLRDSEIESDEDLIALGDIFDEDE